MTLRDHITYLKSLENKYGDYEVCCEYSDHPWDVIPINPQSTEIYIVDDPGFAEHGKKMILLKGGSRNA